METPENNEAPKRRGRGRPRKVQQPGPDYTRPEYARPDSTRVQQLTAAPPQYVEDWTRWRRDPEFDSEERAAARGRYALYMEERRAAAAAAALDAAAIERAAVEIAKEHERHTRRLRGIYAKWQAATISEDAIDAELQRRDAVNLRAARRQSAHARRLQWRRDRYHSGADTW